jgi:hypothetical protein
VSQPFTNKITSQLHICYITEAVIQDCETTSIWWSTWTRFMALAAVHKSTQALKIGGETNMPAKEDAAVDASTDAGKLQSEAAQRNAIAMANLTMTLLHE